MNTAIIFILVFFNLLFLLTTALSSFFAYKLYISARNKTRDLYSVVDLMVSGAEVITENSLFLEGELAQTIGNQQAASYQEMKKGINSLKELVQIYGKTALEIRDRISQV